MKAINFIKGYALVELLIALGFLGVIVVFFMTASMNMDKASLHSQKQSQAFVLARESIEVARHLRDDNYENLEDGVHGLRISSNEWRLFGDFDTVGDFTREVTISSVSANTKLVESKVSWDEDGNEKFMILNEYLSNWQAFIQTGIGDWSTSTVPFILNIAGNSDGWKVNIQGDYAFILLNGGSKFISLDISDALNPVILSNANISGTPADFVIVGDYAYIVGSAGSVSIVDISDPANLSIAGSLSLQGNVACNGIYVAGSYAFVVRSFSNQSGAYEFNVIDVSNPSSPNLVGFYNAPSGISMRDVFVLGDYAYVTTTSGNAEIYIMNISNLTAPSVAQIYNMSGSYPGRPIFGTLNKIFFGTNSGDLFILNSSNPTSLSIIGSVNVGGIINDIDVGNNGNYAFLATSKPTGEFQVVDATSPILPVVLGSNGTPAGVLNGIAYNADGDYVLAVGSDNAEELYVIFPGS